MKNRLILLSLFSFASACVHRPALSLEPSAGLPEAEAAGPEQDYAQAASSVPVNAETTVITEQEIRDLEEGGGAGAEIFISSAPPSAPPPVNLGGNGKITLTRHDTGEKITVRYRNEKGEYNRAELEKINRIMRCSLDNTETETALKLVELLDAVEDKFGKKGLRLLSGYRTLELNRIIKGSAENSLHVLGWAADIRIPGYSSTKVKTFARKLKAGGVGYYPNKGFTHLDVGKVRYWVVKRAPRRRAVRRKAVVRASSKSAKKVSAAHPPARKKTVRK